MPIPKIIAAYGLTALVFFAIDLVWLGMVAKGLYAKHLGHLLADRVNWAAAIVFYLLYIGGIFVFCILPAMERGSLPHAALMGALFGFMAYATYDLTNLATLRDWPLAIVIVDIAWGTVLTGAVASAGYLICQRLS